MSQSRPRILDFESSWNDVTTVLDVLFKAPQLPSRDGGRPTANLSTTQYTLAYSTLVNLSISTRVQPLNANYTTLNNLDAVGQLIYQRLDDYLKTILNDVVSKIEGDTNSEHLLERYLLEYSAYTNALRPMSNIFSKLDQDFVNKRKGWGRDGGNGAFLTARERALGRRWGLPEKFTGKEFKDVQMRIEIATGDDCVIGIKALGLKRWRTQVFDRLKDRPERVRISAAFDELLADAHSEEITNRTELLTRLQKSLEEVGVKSEHPFREELAPGETNSLLPFAE